VGPVCLNVSSFDAAEQVWYAAACPDDRPGEPVSKMSRKPGCPLWSDGRRKRAFPARCIYADTHGDAKRATKKRATGPNISCSLVSFVDYSRFIASIVRLIMSA